ncbi:MAG TPA: acyl-CoA dehydrogenase family protein [Acidimicrobiia bacterium]|nr:acyl-CoA dehydrogenase family protein [Acidimicrobiia bacterium]
MATHTVLNQPPPLVDLNLYTADPVLGRFVEMEGGAIHDELLRGYGRNLGTSRAYGWGRDANRYPPQLITHDQYGNRVDQVEFHPAWHALMDLSISHRVHSLPWVSEEGSFVARAAQMMMMAGVEAGHGCPISMTAAVVPALRHNPEVSKAMEPLLTSSIYDPRFLPPADKDGVLMGMGMTEKQGGSDVRANTTEAKPDVGDWYLITGHKWFTSAPMSDAFLILAQGPAGLTCFYLPRILDDGTVNSIQVLRLKDKLGNRSNASSELEFDNAHALIVGEEGRGVRTIIEMVNGTRLDCVSGSAGLMRQAVMQAAHHVAHRSAFGSKLIDKPAMQMVIADLEVETQAATALMTRLAGAFDRAAGDEEEAAVKRILTPVAKYWVTKRCSPVVREAMECLGGNGYVEESILPRIYRESPLNAIWEGSGNVIALDVMRVAAKEPQAVEALRSELTRQASEDSRLADFVSHTFDLLASPDDPEAQARRITERLAIAVQAALLIERADAAVAEAFLASRVEGDHGSLFGSQPPGPDVPRIASMAVPEQ